MLAQRFRRWPDIETALGDYPVFAGQLRHYYAGDTFFLPSPEKPLTDNTIHWPNAEVILGHRL